jgi:hypothetical protein
MPAGMMTMPSIIQAMPTPSKNCPQAERAGSMPFKAGNEKRTGLARNVWLSLFLPVARAFNAEILFLFARRTKNGAAEAPLQRSHAMDVTASTCGKSDQIWLNLAWMRGHAWR